MAAERPVDFFSQTGSFIALSYLLIS